MGLGTAQKFVVGILSLVLIGVLVLVVLGSVNTDAIKTATGQGSSYIINNTSAGLQSFFTNVPTWLVLVGVVIIILIIAAVIVVINRFSGGNDSM